MYLQEVEKTLQKAVPRGKKASYFDPETYMNTSTLMLGLTVPQQREVFKKGYSFSTLSMEDQLKIWNQVWQQATTFEVLTQAVFFPEKYAGKFDTAYLFGIMKKWIKKVDNWGHSDMLSSIFAKMLVKEPKVIFDQLEKWNSSKNPWERRQSIVPLAMYHRRNQAIGFKPCIQLVENLLGDDDYYVQKGVGWALREIGTQYPEETWKFLQKHVYSISSIAFTASVEKISKERKELLKDRRKK